MVIGELVGKVAFGRRKLGSVLKGLVESSAVVSEDVGRGSQSTAGKRSVTARKHYRTRPACGTGLLALGCLSSVAYACSLAMPSSFATSAESFTTCMRRWQLGQSATTFSMESAPPWLSHFMWCASK